VDINTLKALHIIFVVSWFAGLFYIVRLFIYHTEAQQKPAIEKEILSKQFIEMEKKLWWIITTPAMILTFVFGTWMIALNHEYYLNAPWMHVKLGFVGLLLIYHFVCQKILNDLRYNKFPNFYNENLYYKTLPWTEDENLTRRLKQRIYNLIENW
jgi:putative membrane protein